MSLLGNIIDTILRYINGPMDPKAMEIALDKQAVASSERLDWRNSIVDLMKLTGQDSSLSAREKLAQEMGHAGRFVGSAEQNNWLHAQVLAKLARS